MAPEQINTATTLGLTAPPNTVVSHNQHTDTKLPYGLYHKKNKINPTDFSTQHRHDAYPRNLHFADTK